MSRRAKTFRTALATVAVATAGVLATVPAAHAAVAPIGVGSSSHAATSGTASGLMLTTFSPTKGPMGTKVTITGSGFSGATRVAFHGTSASFRVISNTRIVATAPCGATTGRITVRTPKGTVSSVGSFRFT